jgi:hypothetical protein
MRIMRLVIAASVIFCGTVAANFPARPVFIQTELGPAAAEEEMKNILYDRKYLPRNCPPGGTSWSLAGSYSISCPKRDLGMDSERKEYHEPPIAPSIEPAERNKGGDNVLLDKKIKVSPGKISLVVIPQFTTEERMSTPRGTVYILAVLVQQQGS